MIDSHSIITARQYGEIRCSVASEGTGDMSRVLGKFGLTADASLLVEHDRASAFSLLRDLLWKDMAYGSECMPRAQAEEMADALLRQHGTPQSRYFSNGNWSRREGWNALTESTFDAGLIMAGGDSQYFCIWFQDED